VDISTNIPLRMSNKPYEIRIMRNITGGNKIQLISMEKRISLQPTDSCTELLQFSYFFTRRPAKNESCVRERGRESARKCIINTYYMTLSQANKRSTVNISESRPSQLQRLHRNRKQPLVTKLRTQEINISCCTTQI